MLVRHIVGAAQDADIGTDFGRLTLSGTMWPADRNGAWEGCHAASDLCLCRNRCMVRQGETVITTRGRKRDPIGERWSKIFVWHQSVLQQTAGFAPNSTVLPNFLRAGPKLIEFPIILDGASGNGTAPRFPPSPVHISSGTGRGRAPWVILPVAFGFVQPAPLILPDQPWPE